MSNPIPSRKPTEAELEQLYMLMEDVTYYIVEDAEPRHKDIKTALEAATIVVFENLKSENMQCSGKLMFVIWADHSENNFNLYKWNEDGKLEEVDHIK